MTTTNTTRVAVYNECCTRAGQRCVDDEMLDNADAVASDLTVYDGTDHELTLVAINYLAAAARDRSHSHRYNETVARTILDAIGRDNPVAVPAWDDSLALIVGDPSANPPDAKVVELTVDPATLSASVATRCHVETGTLGDIWRGLRLRCTISEPVDAERLGEWLAESQCQDLLCRIVAGHSTGYRDGNRIGLLSDDASQAWDTLSDLLATGDVARLDEGGYADAYDAYTQCSLQEATGLSDADLLTQTDEQLDALAERMTADGRANGYVIDGTRNFLTHKIAELRGDE